MAESQLLSSNLETWIMCGMAQDQAGAFCAWRDLGSGALSYAYPEITGYALALMANINASTPLSPRSVAKRAAKWLVQQTIGGTFPARPQDGKAVYNFDLAMAATGLMLTGNLHADEEVRDTGLTLIEGIQRQILTEGTLPALCTMFPSPQRPSSWSTHGFTHLLKAVQCLLLAKQNGINNAEEAAALLIEGATRLQQADGRLVTHPIDTNTALHPLLYGAEGLWIWGTAQRDHAAINRAALALSWMWTFQLETGGFPSHVDHVHRSSVGPEQSDVTSQAVRLALLLGYNPAGLDRAIARLYDVIYPDNVGMAVVYQPGMAAMHLNTWSTIFTAQALALAEDRSASLPWTHLV